MSIQPHEALHIIGVRYRGSRPAQGDERAVVSVYGEGEGSAISVASGIELIGSALQSWRRHGLSKWGV